MIFYQAEIVKNGRDICMELMEFSASGDYAQTRAHFHSTMEVLLVVSGEGFYRVGGGEHPFAAGDCFIFDSMEPHNIFSTAPEQDLQYLSLNFVPSFVSAMEVGDFNLQYLAPFYFTDRPCRIPGDCACAQEVRACLQSIQTALYAKEAGYALAAKAQLFVLLAAIARHYQRCGAAEDAHRRSGPAFHETFTKVLDHIEQNLTQDITIDELAQIAAMNRYYFSTFFKKHMAESPMQYITRRRIDRAIELLRDERLSILDVALRSGFNNAANFNRAFKQVTGCSPSEYRKRQKQSGAAPAAPAP